MTTLHRSLIAVALLLALGTSAPATAQNADGEAIAAEARMGYPVPTAAVVWHDTGTLPNLDHRTYGHATPASTPYAPAPQTHTTDGVSMKRARVDTPLAG